MPLSPRIVKGIVIRAEDQGVEVGKGSQQILFNLGGSGGRCPGKGYGNNCRARAKSFSNASDRKIAGQYVKNL